MLMNVLITMADVNKTVKIFMALSFVIVLLSMRLSMKHSALVSSTAASHSVSNANSNTIQH